MSQKKNVLVIGGSGFIGSHLVDELISKKYKVSVLDIKKSKYHKNHDDCILGLFAMKARHITNMENYKSYGVHCYYI